MPKKCQNASVTSYLESKSKGVGVKLRKVGKDDDGGDGGDGGDDDD